MIGASKKNLNGTWDYIADSNGTLTYEQVLRMYQSKKQTKKIRVPANWQLEGIDNFNGTLWYITEFIAPQKTLAQEMFILRFHGIDYFADVWINGIRIKTHEGYFQQFDADITNFAICGKKNLLIVKVTSPKEEPGTIWPLRKQLIKGIFNHHDCRPGSWTYEHGQDKNTGGIWNSVELLFGAEATAKAELRYHESQNNTFNCELKLHLSSHAHIPISTPIVVIITDPDGNTSSKQFTLCYQPGISDYLFHFSMEGVKRWTVWERGEQNVYHFEIMSHFFGAVSVTTGFRTFIMDEKRRCFLNGEPLFLRGTNLIAEQFLSALNSKRINFIARQMREANINIVRIHAHVNRQELYEAFDREGILVWQDFPLQWTYDTSEKFRANACTQIGEMVEQLLHHPSIVFWCCHNEPGEQIESLDPWLEEVVRSKDNSRVIRRASNYEEHPYEGWYWGIAEHYSSSPMGPMPTEFGAQGIPSIKSLSKFLPGQEQWGDVDWKKWEYHDFQYEQTFTIAKIERGKNIAEFAENSQSYQAKVLKEAIKNYRWNKDNGITGIFQFMFIDCWESITWSVIDFYGERKKGYYTIQECYAPVYLAVKLRQDTYLPTSKFNFEFKVVNDSLQELKGLKVRVTIKNRVLVEYAVPDVRPNSSVHIDYEKLFAFMPKWLKLGKHIAKFSLSDSNEQVISSTEESIQVVKRW